MTQYSLVETYDYKFSKFVFLINFLFISLLVNISEVKKVKNNLKYKNHL